MCNRPLLKYKVRRPLNVSNAKSSSKQVSKTATLMAAPSDFLVHMRVSVGPHRLRKSMVEEVSSQYAKVRSQRMALAWPRSSGEAANMSEASPLRAPISSDFPVSRMYLKAAEWQTSLLLGSPGFAGMGYGEK